MKVLIDTDPGIDDAIALAMVLHRKDIDIVGITCVVGNTSVDKTTKNTLKILEAFDRKDIPVFKGAASPMINSKHDGEYYHGSDGLGNCLQNDNPDTSPLQDEIAALAINRICQQHSGEITVIALGPLTNLALALRLNEDLPSHIKELIVMGGNHKGVGNITMAAEFNFFVDPVSAHIVMEEFTCPKYMVTWEMSKTAILTEDDILEYCGRNNKRSQLMESILKPKNGKYKVRGYCDSVAVAIAINRDIIKKKHEVYATVEMHGNFTKGAVVIDWNPHFRQVGEKKPHNVIIPDEIDVQAYKKLFMDSTL